MRSEQWDLGPGQKREASNKYSSVSSLLLVPFDTQQLVGGCSSGHSFMLLLSCWLPGAVLQLGAAAGTWSSPFVPPELWPQDLFSVLALLEDKEQAVT